MSGCRPTAATVNVLQPAAPIMQAATEATLRDNHRAMSHYVFRPRVLRDVSQIDTTTTFLGMPLALPIMTAPMGSMYLLHPDGDIALARGARRQGTMHWLSTVSSYTPEEVAEATDHSRNVAVLQNQDVSFRHRFEEEIVEAHQSCDVSAEHRAFNQNLQGRRQSQPNQPADARQIRLPTHVEEQTPRLALVPQHRAQQRPDQHCVREQPQPG